MKKNLLKLITSISGFLTKLGLHRMIPFRRKIYDFLFGNLWTGGEIIEIQGSKMDVNTKEQDPMMRQTLQTYALNLVHEEVTTELFKKMVRKGDVVVDMGANIGYFSLLSSKLVGNEGKVFSFEPNPKNFEYLNKNIKLNNYQNITTEQKAVSNINGKTKLFICPYDSGHHTINQADGVEAYRLGRKGEINSIDIETVTIDDYLKDKTDRVDIMKIDVEGAEALAFSGMEETLKNNKDIKIFLEFFPLLISKMGSSPEDFIREIMEKYGFSIFVVGQDYNAKNEELLKINRVDDLMNLCKKKEDHLNLFIRRS